MARIANGNNSDTDFLHESSASEDNWGGFLEVSCLGKLWLHHSTKGDHLLTGKKDVNYSQCLGHMI
jgi:hypothetical protein